MHYFTLFSIILSLIGCSGNSQEGEARRSFNRFLEATTEDQIRASIILPKSLAPATGDEIVKECLLFKNYFKTPPPIQAIEIRGRWARADLNTEPAGMSLIALNLNGQWQVYWDPAGVLIWGLQKNHPLGDLSKGDWDDYHSIQITRGEQAMDTKPH